MTGQLDHSGYVALTQTIELLQVIEADHEGEPYGEEAGDLAAEIADFRERWQ